MTVEERQGKENGGHGGRDQFPVGMRVLAVDDNPTCLKVLESLLRKCQYHVTTIGQAAMALKLLRENRDQFDLVISDVHMPDMDGFKLLELVGLEMDLPVIMLSGNGETETVMKGITHGACDYLLKPVRIEQLRNIWQHVVRRKFDARNNSSCGNGGGGQKVQSANADGEQGGANRNKKQLRKDREENGDDWDESDGNNNDNPDSPTQKKPRVVWSVELHRKFVAAVNQLGIDKAVPKKILDLMNVENITRENVASHLQKYRLYLKRISIDAGRQANLAAAFGGRNPTYINMNALESFKYYHAYGRHRSVPTVASSQSNSLLARMNSPSALGMHGLLPPEPIQLGHAQSNLGTSLKGFGGVGHGSNLLNSAPMLLQDASKCFATDPSCNSFSNISNSAPLAPAHRFPLQCLESSNQPSVQPHLSSTDPFNALVRESPQFPDLGRCSNIWQNAVPSKFSELAHKDSVSQVPSHMSCPRPFSSFTAPSGHSAMMHNELQDQIASLPSNSTPMAGFNQEMAPFNFGSNLNSRDVLNNNLALSRASCISSTLPNLGIDNSIPNPMQSVDGKNPSGIPLVQDSTVDQGAVGDQLGYSNDFVMGIRNPQSGLSAVLDDITVNMFKQDVIEDVASFMDGDWEIVSIP